MKYLRRYLTVVFVALLSVLCIVPSNAAESDTEETPKTQTTVLSNEISNLTIKMVSVKGAIVTKVDDYTPFYIEGTALSDEGTTPESSILSLTIYNKETGEEVTNYLVIAKVVNEKYKYGPVFMPDNYADGTYQISAHLVDISGIYPELRGMVYTEFDYVKEPDISLKAIYKQSTRVGSYINTLKYPNGFANYQFLKVDGVGRPISGEDVGAKITLKKTSNIDMQKSKFVVTTGYGNYTFGVKKSGSDLSATLYGICADASTVTSVTAYIVRTDGLIEEYYIGTINVVSS